MWKIIKYITNNEKNIPYKASKFHVVKQSNKMI